MGRQWCDRPASSLSPTTHVASSQESTVRGRHSSPRTSGQSRLGPREFSEDASERTAFCTIHLYSLSLHPHRYVNCAVGAACTASGGVAHAAQPVLLAHAHNSTRLRDSVRQAPSQVQRRSRDVGGSPERPCLARGIAVLLAKDAIEPVPPAERRQGFYSPYFIVPKNCGGLRPILDLRVLNRALHKLPLKMRTRKRIIKCIQPQDLFAAIDLKDVYFMFRSFCDTDRSYGLRSKVGHGSTRSSPSGSPCLPRVFTKVVEGALTPLREVGVRILNYLDDWLILAQSREQLGDHRDLVLRHLSQLGLRVNWEKSKLSLVQRIYFLGVEIDSVSMTARLTEERAQAVLNCQSSFRSRNVVPLKQFQRLLGHMASAAAVTPLGLLHMRPLQHWLHSRVPRWAWRRGTL